MGFGLEMYDNHPADMPGKDYFIGEMSSVKLPVKAGNNLYLNGANPYKNGVGDVVKNNSGIEISLVERKDGIYLELEMSGTIDQIESKRVNSFSFGKAMVPGVIFDKTDGSPVLFSSDYFNENRDGKGNSIGPFTNLWLENKYFKVWPK